MSPLERKPDAGESHVRFDERGVETECTTGYSGTGNRKGRTPATVWPKHHRATPRLYKLFGAGRGGWLRCFCGAIRALIIPALAIRQRPFHADDTCLTCPPSSPTLDGLSVDDVLKAI
jgi:hypothetical protein